MSPTTTERHAKKTLGTILGVSTMAGGGSARMLALMTTPHTIRIGLELSLSDGTVQGHAIDEDGSSHRFTGWLGLLGALDALVGEPADPPSPLPR